MCADADSLAEQAPWDMPGLSPLGRRCACRSLQRVSHTYYVRRPVSNALWKHKPDEEGTLLECMRCWPRWQAEPPTLLLSPACAKAADKQR